MKRPADLTTLTYCDHPGLNKLFQDVAAMPIIKIKSLTEAVIGAELFLTNHGFESFDGKMLVQSNYYKASPQTERSLMLGMNVMRWLTKFYLPEITKGFGKVYRMHATKEKSIEVGQNYTFKPRKPLLSWSETESVDVSGRDNVEKVYDYLITMKVNPKDVVWSHKSSLLREHARKARFNLGIALPAGYASKYMYSKPKITPKSTLEDHVFLFVTVMRNLFTGIVDKEFEVTVYHGKQPFTAKVIEKIVEEDND